MAHRQAYRLWPVFRLLRLPVLLWYAHGAVTWHLRLAHRSVDRVISSSPEGFRLRSARAHFIGQGVDTELFSLRPPAAARPHLLAVGRISRRKRLDLLVSMMAHLRGDGLTLRIVGPTLTGDDAAYAAALRRDVAGGRVPVEFLGPVPMDRLPGLYDTAALALNVSETNSMDKAVLEALATGCPVLSSNPAFRELLADHPMLVIKDERPEAIAAQLRALLADPGAAAPEVLRRLVEGHHDIRSYADRVMAHLTAVMRR
jgi:glycosyltransferase involved in cell wall biosynthesis